ncbi:MAG: hypothetical protein NTW49_03195 [Bacteroidia bacterium]|nr:hypothetical protein [Bacteroidia bacterium]
MNEIPAGDKIIISLKEKSALKLLIYDNTLSVLNMIKQVVNELSAGYNNRLESTDFRVRLEYTDKGMHDMQLRVAGDLLVFSMHTNVFHFDRDHPVWKTSYVKNDPMATYCGVINIYNFLNDSFKYNRNEDQGYLIARLFVNKEMCYFVEGKRQLGFLYNNFGKEKITRESVSQIINTAIQYSLDFDLLVPPYDSVKIMSVEQMTQKIENSKILTGKRLGFKFNSDDVS